MSAISQSGLSYCFIDYWRGKRSKFAAKLTRGLFSGQSTSSTLENLRLWGELKEREQLLTGRAGLSCDAGQPLRRACAERTDWEIQQTLWACASAVKHVFHYAPLIRFSWCVFNIIFIQYFQTKRILFIHNTLSSEPPLNNGIFCCSAFAILSQKKCSCGNRSARNDYAVCGNRIAVRLQYFVKKK